MKKLYGVLAVAFLLFSVQAFATVEIDTRGLSDAQKAQLVLEADKLRQSQDSAVTDAVKNASPEDVSKWSQMGKAVAETIGATAKELSISVNEFAKTDVGKMTMFLIVYKMVGASVVTFISHIVGAIILSILLIHYRRGLNVSKVEYETMHRWYGDKRVVKTITREDPSGEMALGQWIVQAGFVVFIFVCIINAV